MPRRERTESEEGSEEESEEETNEDEEEEEEEESSSVSGPPAPPSIVAGRFRVKDQIGKGSYSVVHRGTDRDRGDKVALKLEWVKAEKGRRLLMEAKIFEILGKCTDVPQIRWAGRQGPYNIMVMDLEGPSLDARFTACGRKFGLQTVLMLGQQMVERIEYVHSRGIIHRDIKPHNFLMGRGDRRGQVLIMDLGLAKRYKDPETGRHISMTKHRGITGTVRYASLNVHKGYEPSRRDDLEAIGFVIMHFLRGGLPWQGLKGSSKRAKHEKIRRCKKKTSMEELCRGHPREFVSFLQHCRELSFAERPDYAYLKRLFSDLVQRERFRHDRTFDWSEADGTASTTARRSKGSPAPKRRSRSRSPSKRHRRKASRRRRRKADEVSRSSERKKPRRRRSRSQKRKRKAESQSRSEASSRRA